MKEGTKLLLQTQQQVDVTITRFCTKVLEETCVSKEGATTLMKPEEVSGPERSHTELAGSRLPRNLPRDQVGLRAWAPGPQDVPAPCWHPHHAVGMQGATLPATKKAAPPCGAGLSHRGPLRSGSNPFTLTVAATEA